MKNVPLADCLPKSQDFLNQTANSIMGNLTVENGKSNIRNNKLRMIVYWSEDRSLAVFKTSENKLKIDPSWKFVSFGRISSTQASKQNNNTLIPMSCWRKNNYTKKNHKYILFCDNFICINLLHRLFLRRPKGRRSNIALALNYSPIRSIFKL